MYNGTMRSATGMMAAMSGAYLRYRVMEVFFMSDPHNEPLAQAKLHWYRIPLDRALLAELNQRGDALGFAQTLGHLGVISATGALSWYASQHWSWFVLAGCLFLHGTVYAFLLNAFHEL